MSPAPLNRKSTAGQITSANQRQATRVAAGRCALSAKHGPPYKAGRCRSCYERMLARRVERYRPKHGGREVPAVVYMRVRADVIASGAVSHSHPGEPTGTAHQGYLRAVSRETDRRLARGGWYIVRAVNVPPPGWTVELDIAEELAALSELVAMRRVG